MEFYATAQELVVWTGSTLLPTPTYDTGTKRWSVIIDRNGTEVPLNPSHIVLAAGAVGPPRIPDISTLNSFTGEKLHSSEFHGAAPYKGKRVVVIGAGNSSADICQDCCFQGAASVTMVQRSSTTIMKNESILDATLATFPLNEPTDVSDFRNASMPWGLKREVILKSKDAIAEAHKEMHDGLRSRGFDVNLSDGTGTLLKFHSSYGGRLFSILCCSVRVLTLSQLRILYEPPNRLHYLKTDFCYCRARRWDRSAHHRWEGGH